MTVTGEGTLAPLRGGVFIRTSHFFCSQISSGVRGQTAPRPRHGHGRSGMTRDLSRLLRPRSIAVLGAGWAQNVVEQCAKMGFAGPVWPVHPTRDRDRRAAGLSGRSPICPQRPDATFIGVNRHATLDVVARTCRDGGGRGDLLCLAAGPRRARRTCRRGWSRRRATCRSWGRTAMASSTTSTARCSGPTSMAGGGWSGAWRCCRNPRTSSST